jgi:chromosome segregation ATPase
MNRFLQSSIVLLLLAATPAPSVFAAAAPVPAKSPAIDVKQLDAQIAARQQRITALREEIIALDNGIQARVNKVVTELVKIQDSKDSGTRVANIKEDVIDFLRKQITDYARRRRQIRAELDNPNRVIPEALLTADIAKIDARIGQRIEQVVQLGGSFAEHRDYDRYTATGNGWWGGTTYAANEDYNQNRRTQTKANQQKGKLIDALDETIKRLEFENRSLKIRLASSTGQAAVRVQADIAHNTALIETLKGKRVDMLMNGGKTGREIGLKDALALTERLKEVASDIRRDQTKLTGYYNDLNTMRYQVTVLEAQKKGLPTPAPAL